MSFSLSFILIAEVLAIFVTSTFGEVKQLDNEYCKARPTLVPVDDPLYRYFPHMVTLHRCGGTGYGSPNNVPCASDPATEEIVTISVFSLSTQQNEAMRMVNHTSCRDECAIKESDCDSSRQVWDQARCMCECNTVPETCNNNMEWSNEKCGCICPLDASTSCPENKVWDPTSCQCVCKASCFECAMDGQALDPETCLCGDLPKLDRFEQEKPRDGIRIEFFIGVVAAQFVFLYAIFEVMMYPKQAGFLYKLKQKCSRQRRQSIMITTERCSQV